MWQVWQSGSGLGVSWLRLWSQMLLWRLMGVGTTERLKRTVLILGGMSWWLKGLSICHSSSSSRWEGLFRMMEFILSIILLSATGWSPCSSCLTTRLDFGPSICNLLPTPTLHSGLTAGSWWFGPHLWVYNLLICCLNNTKIRRLCRIIVFNGLVNICITNYWIVCIIQEIYGSDHLNEALLP